MTMLYPALSVEDLNAWELPERSWAVEDLLPTGSLSLLTGREKAGKSLLLLDLVASVAAGEPFLGRAVCQGPAALLFLEDHPGDVRSRVTQRLGSRSVKGLPLYFIPADGSVEEAAFHLTDPEEVERLANTIRAFGWRVVAIDPLRETHDLAENDADQMAPIIRPLRKLAHQLDVAIVLAHHQNKGGEARGSTAIRAAVDQEIHWKVDEEATGLSGVLRIMGRSGPKQRIGAELGEEGRFLASAGTGRITEVTTHERIVTALGRHPEGLETPDVVAAVNGDGHAERAQGTIATALSRLVSQGTVVADGDGGRKGSRRYRLADRSFSAGPLGEGVQMNDAPTIQAGLAAPGPSTAEPVWLCFECGQRPVADSFSFCEECAPF